MVGLLAGLLLDAPAFAGDVTEQARQLATLRAEVEALSAQLTLEQEDLSSRLRAVDAQRTDLEVQVRREELRLQQLDQAAQEQRQAVLAASAAGDVLRPALAESFAAIAQSIEQGLPYRRDERLQALTDLRAQLDQGLLPPQQAAARLWALVEDERRLAREHAIDRQVVVLDGQEVLVRVARLGMVALLFSAEDGRVGWAERGSDGAWGYAVAADRAQQTRVGAVFDSLEKQVRVGWFEVPGPALAHLAAPGGAP